MKGYSQRAGINYNVVYSPVGRYSTIRFHMALVDQYDLEIEQLDAGTAFLQGKFKDKEIDMEQLEGHFGVLRQVCKSQKALYGPKQSSRD